MHPFADLLAYYLKERNITQCLFAERIGVTQAYLSRVLRGQRAIPYEGIEAWADALALTGIERERFLLLGEATRASERVQEFMARYLADSPEADDQRSPPSRSRKTDRKKP